VNGAVHRDVNAGGPEGVGLTAAKMNECRLADPELVAQAEFVEWVPDGHLRHSRGLSAFV